MALDGYCSPQQGYHADRGDDLPGTQPELRGRLETVSEEKPGDWEAATSIGGLGVIHTSMVAHSFSACQEANIRGNLTGFCGAGRIDFRLADELVDQ